MLHCEIGTIVAGLNPEQAAAVAAPVGAPLLVLAGAGCGKTTVLTRRIAFLAGEFCPADAVLALTFTRAAAREMAERVAAFAKVNAGSGPPLITTFHAYCLRLLLWKSNGAPLYTRLGYRERPRLVSGKRRLQMIAEACTREERLLLCADVLELSALLARRAVFNPGAPGTPDLEAVVLDIERRYARAKKEAGLWDFSDFIAGALELMDNHVQAASGFLSRFRAVLVDEFQDTNPAQIRLLEKIIVPAIPLFAVGDDDQAIYGFQGADRAAVLEFGARFPGAGILKLQTNYRSTPAILSAANRIFRSKPKAFRKVLVAGRSNAGSAPLRRAVKKVVFESEEDMASWLAASMERLAGENGVAPSGVAVLFRLNQTLDRVDSMLSALLVSCERRPQLLTVHGSKGREFEAVFLCDLEEGVFPKKQAHRTKVSWRERMADLLGITDDDRGEMGEEKRLFYVGVTRAKRFLWLVSVRNKELYGRTRRFEPSRFLRLI
ncbi:MAG TPA: ATP-dependent helicase [Chitinivibrionales bacterium]|jgi:DNA helicase-2/ATP-dependent DNA helicase PcrA|nr:ATP-dependent helicase [Chitinivibrionales bacterium]